MSVYETKELNCKKIDSAYFTGKMHINITQTFQSVNNTNISYNTTGTKSFKVLYYMKPLIKYLTTIDFGYLITQNDILSLNEKSGYWRFYIMM